MGAGDESDGVNNQAASSHSSVSHPKACEEQCCSETLAYVSTSTIECVEINNNGDTLGDTRNISLTQKNSSLEDEVCYPALLDRPQSENSNTSDHFGIEELVCQTQTYTKMHLNTSMCSEHTSKCANVGSLNEHDVKEDMKESDLLPYLSSMNYRNSEVNSGEVSSSQNWSSKFKVNSHDIPIVDVLHPLERTQADRHPPRMHSKFVLAIPHSKNGSRYGNGILDRADDYCGSKQFNSGDAGMRHKAPSFNGAIDGMCGTNGDFVGQTGDTSTIPKWQKILYERQPFEDNYVDPLQFLEDLRQNEHLKTYEYTEVVKDTFAITQQISIVILFVCAFSMLLNQTVNHYIILYIDLAVFLITFVVYLQFQVLKTNGANTQDYVPIHLTQMSQVSSPVREKRDVRAGGRYNNDLIRANSRLDNAPNGVKHRSTNLKRGFASNSNHNGNSPFHGDSELGDSKLPYIESAFSFFRKTIGVGVLLVLLTPILSTLTVSYSNDTIVALSIFTMALHVLTTNYSYLNAYTTDFSPNLSVNAASFGVIMMASRIPNPLYSGALIAFGAFCFSLSPIVRHFVKRTFFTAHVAITFLLFGIATGCLLTIPILVILYVTCILMISFVIPWWFVSLHSSVKDQINGPWDEAKPTNSAAAAEWANAGLLS